MQFIDKLTEIIGFINDNILWGIPMILIILGAGILLTVRSKVLQVCKFKTSVKATIVPTVKSIFKKDKAPKKNGEKSVSQFEAFSAAISGTVGTGNIVGVAGALISGGPGAIFWMWVSAFFGMMTNYSENVLGLYFRKKDKDGNFSGGPMYYIEKGLGLKPLAKFFAFCCTLAAIGMSMVQVNSISGTIQNVAPGNDTVVAWIVGIAVAVIVALIVIGGIQRIGKVASAIVPFMALFFIAVALIIICINITAVPAAFAVIFKNAFSLKSFSGGLFGYTLMAAMRYGFARGIFSNEAGLGSSVIAHSASETREPVKQGMWGIFEVFLDTFVICTLTALTLVTTGIKSGIYDFTDIAGNAGTLTKAEVSSSAFSSNLGVFGTIAFSIILPLFAFTTILAWSYYGKKSAEYLFPKKTNVAGNVFSVIFVLLIVVGAITASDFVWGLDDMFNALMAIPNLIGVVGLSGTVMKVTKNYFDRKKGLPVKPMLSAYEDMNEQFAKELAEEESSENL